MRKSWQSDNLGGAREGAGRPKMGESKSLRINLPEDAWKDIDSWIEQGKYSNYSEYFRKLHVGGQ
ncbi:hypothetical protein PZ740_06370, partial [Rhodospirillales bacterium YIM 152171]|nr:hypothetical protein [Marinimicrococcus flavescens]